jgi:hypothetical protein
METVPLKISATLSDTALVILKFEILYLSFGLPSIGMMLNFATNIMAVEFDWICGVDFVLVRFQLPSAIPIGFLVLLSCKLTIRPVAKLKSPGMLAEAIGLAVAVSKGTDELDLEYI